MNITKAAREERARRAAAEDVEPVVYVGEAEGLRPPMDAEYKRQLRAALDAHGVGQIIVRYADERQG